MPARRRSRSSTPTEAPARDAGTRPDLTRLTNLVALLVVKGESQADQIRTLAAAGFGNSEIAGLLGLTPNAVNVALHRLRRRK